MNRLSSNYLGMELKNPLVPSASPLSKNLDSALSLEDAGAGALVMYSLFAEEVSHHQELLASSLLDQRLGFAEADDFLPLSDHYQGVAEQYLEQIRRLKQRLGIPVIASLNGVELGDWLELAADFELAGADAIELNLYAPPAALDQMALQVEANYLSIVRTLRQQTSLPIVVKLSHQFSSPGQFIKQVELTGVQGVSLFNRFYQPDIDLDTGKPYPSLTLSTPQDYHTALHWIALLYGKTRLSLCATGGIHDAQAALKLISVGADVTHMASVLIKDGAKVIAEVLQAMEQWLDLHEIAHLRDLKGRSAFQRVQNPSAYQRLNYYQNLNSFSTS